MAYYPSHERPGSSESENLQRILEALENQNREL